VRDVLVGPAGSWDALLAVVEERAEGLRLFALDLSVAALRVERSSVGSGS
jgi:hypothetical protein